MSYRLPSYEPYDLYSHCNMGSKIEPCWGHMEIIEEVLTDDDSYLLFACQGHYWAAHGGDYVSSNRSQDYDAEPVDDGE